MAAAGGARGPTALILEPARDLAEQTHDCVVRFSKHLVRCMWSNMRLHCVAGLRMSTCHSKQTACTWHASVSTDRWPIAFLQLQASPERGFDNGQMHNQRLLELGCNGP